MKEVLTDFWGDAIEIDDDAALTWMRQAHYYMGLYSYTYSAGLVISTAGYLHLKNSETGAEDWLNLLKSGGSKTPLESAMIIGADISTDKPLRDTIQFLSDTVDQIIAYSAELGSKGIEKFSRMMFMGLLSVILFVLVVAIFKNVVEGRDVKFELTVELVLIVIYVILYQIVFN